MRISDWSSDVCSSDLWPTWRSATRHIAIRYTRGRSSFRASGVATKSALWGRRAGAKGIYRHRAARRRGNGGSRCKSSRWSTRPSVSGVQHTHRFDWGRLSVAYIAADAHLLAPKLRTLSPHDTEGGARRHDGWNALERVRLLDLDRKIPRLNS